MFVVRDISKSEWWFVGLIAGVIIIFTTIPMVVGFVATPTGAYFTGVHSLAPGDYYVYFSNILQTYDGHILFKDLYTTESGQYNIINIFWNFAGILGKIFSLSPLLAFHVVRILMIPVLLCALYCFASFFYKETMKRRVVFLFLCFSTGVGGYFEWLFAKTEMVQGYYAKPMDLWVAESNIFLSMLHSGHMVLSLAILVLIFLLYLLALEKNKYLYSAISGILSLLLLSFHPFLFPVIVGVLLPYAIFLFIKKTENGIKHFYHLGIIVIWSLPMILYYGFMMFNDVVTEERARQNINLTTEPLLLLVGYGFLFICAIGGIVRFFQKPEKDMKIYFLFIWILAQGILIYMPVNFQRRMVEGLQIPIVFFAVEFLWYIYYEIKKRMANAFMVKYVLNNPIILIYILVALFAPSNLFVWARDIALYIEKSPLVYLSEEVVAPMKWLKKQGGEPMNILADVNSSYFISGIAGKTVFAGHAVETLYFEDKEKMVKKFFLDNTNDEAKMRFLQNYKITHIYYGKREKDLGEYRPEEKKYLTKVYSNGEVRIYKVNF